VLRFKTTSKLVSLPLSVFYASIAASQVNSNGSYNQNVGNNNGVITQTNNISIHKLSPNQLGLEVVPSVSLDPQEAFRQQFRVTNTGSVALANLHYACAILSYTSKTGSSLPIVGPPPHRVHLYYLLVPVMRPLKSLTPAEKTTIDCDYLTRPGVDLVAAEIELEAAFKVKGNKEENQKRFKFFARRDSTGNFQWTEGASKDSPFEHMATDEKRETVVNVIPFGGDNRILSPCPSPQEYFSLLLSWSNRLHATGNGVMMSTMMKGRYESCDASKKNSDLPEKINEYIRSNAHKMNYMLDDVASFPPFSPGVQ